jgi:hypothetical protein
MYALVTVLFAAAIFSCTHVQKEAQPKPERKPITEKLYKAGTVDTVKHTEAVWQRLEGKKYDPCTKQTRRFYYWKNVGTQEITDTVYIAQGEAVNLDSLANAICPGTVTHTDGNDGADGDGKSISKSSHSGFSFGDLGWLWWLFLILAAILLFIVFCGALWRLLLWAFASRRRRRITSQNSEVISEGDASGSGRTIHVRSRTVNIYNRAQQDIDVANPDSVTKIQN